jgi:hypothetical protein
MRGDPRHGASILKEMLTLAVHKARTFFLLLTPLVIVPRNQFDEVLVQRDTSLGIEDGGVGVAVHVSGDNLVLGVSKYAWTYVSSNHERIGEIETYP